MQVNAFPPIDCLSRQVSFESLYGTQMPPASFFPLARSLRAVITYLRVKSDLLISILSFCVFPSTFVSSWRSDPARSTSYNLLMTMLSGCSASIYSTVIENIVCDLEEVRFILWLPITLFLSPQWKSRRISWSVWHQKLNKFSTV